MENRLHQECHTRSCRESEELRRVCCEETDRARQLRIDELSMQLERGPNTLSHLRTQIQDARDFHDPDTASSFGGSHVPNQP